MYCNLMSNVSLYLDMGYMENVDTMANRWRHSYNKGLSAGAYKEMVKQCKNSDVDIDDVIDRIHEYNLFDR